MPVTPQIVDEQRDITVSVNYSSVTFHPNQVLSDAGSIALATANGIHLRNVPAQFAQPLMSQIVPIP